VLFKIDPVAFRGGGKKPPKPRCAEANDQLNNCREQKKAALTPRIDLAKKSGWSNSRHSLRPGPGSGPISSRRKSDLGNLESEFLAADATESQARAQIAKSEADLINARFDLEGCVHLAPANGRVANLFPATRRARDPVSRQCP